MSFVAAKCTKCGGFLQVDDTQEAAVCTSCGTPFIVEKAINNYNTTVVNNVQADSVVMEAVDTEYLSKLQKQKAEVNKLKNDKNYTGGLTLAGSKYSGLIDVDLYYDKADAWYYNALTMYYKTVKRSFDYDNKDWIQSFERAIELTADINRKEDLVLELDNLKKEQAAIADQRGEYEKELREAIINAPESLDGKYLVIRNSIKDHSGILSFFEGKLYHIPVPLGSTDKITEIADIDTLYLIAPNINVTQRKEFFAPFQFCYESKEYDEDYGSYKSLNSVYITSDRNKTTLKEVERMGVSFNYFKGARRESYVFELRSSNEKEVCQDVLRLCAGKCIVCGAPIKHNAFLDTYKCTGSCGHIPMKKGYLVFKN